MSRLLRNQPRAPAPRRRCATCAVASPTARIPARNSRTKYRPCSGPGCDLAILIILAAFTLHLLRNLLLQEPAFDHRPLRLSIIGCEIAVMVIASALLWSRRPLSMKVLRTLELTIFGMIAAFFAWLQFDAHHDAVMRGAIAPEGRWWSSGRSAWLRLRAGSS